MTDDAINLHDWRTDLKLLKDTGKTALYENMSGRACPACGESFDELLASERRHHSLDPPARVALCVRREEGRLLVFTHER